jgi:hypothetical protein
MRLPMSKGRTVARNVVNIALLLLGGAFASACQGPEPFTRLPETTRVQCSMTRQECGLLFAGPGGWQCSKVGSLNGMKGDVCVSANDPRLASPADLCRQTFCTHDVNAPGTCDISLLTTPTVTPDSPVCKGGSLAQIRNVTVHSVRPDLEHPVDATHFTGVLINATLGTANDPPICVPAYAKPLNWVRPDANDVSDAVSIGQVILPPNQCTEPSDQVVFNLPAGSMGTATSGTTTVPLNALRAHAKVGKSCFDEICVLKTLDAFQVDLADMNVSGVQLRKLRVDIATPAALTTIQPPDSPPFLGVAPGALRFRAEGQVNGVDTQFTAVTTTPFRVDAATNFRLLGNLDVTTPGPTGALVTVRIAVNSNGVVATPQQAACTNLSGLDRLLGFEDPQTWSTAAADLSLVTSPVTQGCGALGVRGSNFIPIVGAPFSTVGLATNNALSVDLFIPPGQPNPFYTGALQMHLSCPSGGVSNQYIGQVELTGKPLNQYSTLRFSLPQAVRTTLARQLNDCSFTLSLNVNPTGNTWILDRLRFTP